MAKAELMKSKDEAERAAAEVERLRVALDSTVPRPQLDAANDAVRLHEAEIERLKKLLEGMVAKAQLDSIRDEAARLAGEMERLRRQLEGTVAKSLLDGANDEIAALRAEIERLKAEIERQKQLMSGMVPRDELERALADAEALRQQLADAVAEGAALRAQLESLRRRLAEAEAEAAALRAEAERLQRALSAAEAAAAALRADLDGARLSALQACVPAASASHFAPEPFPHRSDAATVCVFAHPLLRPRKSRNRRRPLACTARAGGSCLPDAPRRRAVAPVGAHPAPPLALVRAQHQTASLDETGSADTADPGRARPRRALTWPQVQSQPAPVAAAAPPRRLGAAPEGPAPGIVGMLIKRFDDDTTVVRARTARARERARLPSCPRVVPVRGFTRCARARRRRWLTR